MGQLLDELLAAQETYFDKLRNTGEESLKEAFKEIFDKHPSIYSIEWKQYTPYFNDGDPCYFRVGEWEVEWADDEDEEEKDNPHDAANDEQAKALESIEEFFSAVDDDILEAVFGDHVQIEVTAEGISVEEYDHD